MATLRFQTIPGQSEQARTLDKVKSVTWLSLKLQKDQKTAQQPIFCSGLSTGWLFIHCFQWISEMFISRKERKQDDSGKNPQSKDKNKQQRADQGLGGFWF